MNIDNRSAISLLSTLITTAMNDVITALGTGFILTFTLFTFLSIFR